MNLQLFRHHRGIFIFGLIAQTPVDAMQPQTFHGVCRYRVVWPFIWLSGYHVAICLVSDLPFSSHRRISLVDINHRWSVILVALWWRGDMGHKGRPLKLGIWSWAGFQEKLLDYNFKNFGSLSSNSKWARLKKDNFLRELENLHLYFYIPPYHFIYLPKLISILYY